MSSELVGLTEAERGEIATIEGEMATTRPDWSNRNHYWHSEARQQRYRDLLSKAERGSQPAVPASKAAEEKANEIIRRPDYYQRADLQAEVLRLLSGEAAEEGDGDAPPARRGDLGAYAEALGTSEAGAAAMLHSWQSIGRAAEDATALEIGFSELPEGAQRACLRALADPGALGEIVGGLAPADYRRLNDFLVRIERYSPEANAAIRAALEL